MSRAAKKTIRPPADLAKEAEATRLARVGRRLRKLRGIQGYWGREARSRGLLSEQGLERYLRKA
jgi:hypothetical protein